MGADTLALLGMAAHLIGSRFSPVIGRMLDHLGVSRSLAIEGGYFAGAFLFAAFAAWGRGFRPSSGTDHWERSWFSWPISW